MKYIILSHLTRVLLAKLRKYHASHDQLIVFSQDYIGEEIFSYGLYESNELRLISKVLNFNLKKYNILDVGANIGNHTVFLSKIFKEVHSVEPHPLTHEILRLNTRNCTNVSIYQLGFSNKNGKAKLIDQEGNQGGAKLSFTEGIDIQIRRGDEILGTDFAFIKIDVEGHELPVLEGLQNCISKNLPIVSFELINENNEMEILTYLEELGYEFFIPYQRSIFPEYWKRHRYLRNLIDELIFPKKPMLKSIVEFKKDFYNLIFAVHPESEFGINKIYIRK